MNARDGLCHGRRLFLGLLDHNERKQDKKDGDYQV